tara:strand:- start:514 stop:858 length:345 start_codon:yes stop_codon:yes gene_type:complete
MNLENNIKKWVTLDNNYKKVSNDLKKIRDQKNEINNEIIHYFNTNNLKFPNINISDGKLSFYQVKQGNLLTYKFLESCLSEYFNDDETVNEIIDFIKKKRVYSEQTVIKRIYNK